MIVLKSSANSTRMQMEYYVTIDGEAVHSIFGHPSAEAAVNYAIREFDPFKNEYEYVGDGDVYCAECIRKEVLEKGASCVNQVAASDRQSTGQSCGGCHAYIYEPFCYVCGDEFNDDNIEFTRISGDVAVCSHCVGKHVVDGYAVKTGRLQYDFDYALQKQYHLPPGTYSAAR